MFSAESSTISGEILRRGISHFAQKLNAVPSEQWTVVFHEYQRTECTLGNLAVARINNDVIEFEVPEDFAKAAAEVARRCIQKTNSEAAKREAARKQDHEIQQSQIEADEKRLKDKFYGGL